MPVKVVAYNTLEEIVQFVNNTGLTAFEVDQSQDMNNQYGRIYWLLFYNSEEEDADTGAEEEEMS